jgi:3-hydroxybutyryl-CoA dehydrogenase
MDLLIIGNDAAFAECQARLGHGHTYKRAATIQHAIEYVDDMDAVFDFSEAHSAESIDVYCRAKGPIVFLNTTFTTLSTILVGRKPAGAVFGFCGLPTFFNREVLEVAVADDAHRTKLETTMLSLQWKAIVVKDQVGFVTPRVVCMIVNEAFDALQSGVASRADIDLSMKLGTNYPFGPFEWSERIGVDQIKKLLQAVHYTTGDSRYKPMF